MINKSVAFIVLAALLFGSCNEKVDEMVKVDVDMYEGIPDDLKNVFEAHGGLEQWNKMSALTYRLVRGERNEVHKIDLDNRKVRLEGGEWVIGFDGEEVWVSPDKVTYGGNSARFYHNLIFYFYAMPFVLADPGIIYETLEPAEIQGKMLNRVSIKYGDGVGDAPDDEYIICFDPETNKMEWLLYTVTYFANEPTKKYNALHYDKWNDVSGILLPSHMIGYKTSGDRITEKRYENVFEDISVAEEAFDQSIFEMPEVAEIDSLQ